MGIARPESKVETFSNQPLLMRRLILIGASLGNKIK
jgi:hypothetical protein